MVGLGGRILLLLCCLTSSSVAEEDRPCAAVRRLQSWPRGGRERLTAASSAVAGEEWELVLTFTASLARIKQHTYRDIPTKLNGTSATIRGSGDVVDFVYAFDTLNGDHKPTVVTAELNGKDICDDAISQEDIHAELISSRDANKTVLPAISRSTCSSPDSKYDYRDVLGKSILFYEAQRSGPIPWWENRVPWRGDSALGDLIQGGWYDAGDFVKFGFPMAGSCTQLLWGAITFKQGYEKAGELDNMINSVLWVTDYTVRAHTAENEFVGQIGNGDIDHAYWGRPEDMTMHRPAYKIHEWAPGSDLAAEASACLSAASVFYHSVGRHDKGDEALHHARQLFEFADRSKGKYSDSIPEAANFYRSWSGFGDELTWAAAWLFKATNDGSYLVRAEWLFDHYNIGTSTPDRFDWDNKQAGAYALLLEATGDWKYKDAIDRFYDRIAYGQYTPKGLRFLDSWGSLRHAANVAHVFFQIGALGYRSEEMNKFGESQIDYILGDSGRSYVIGFGHDFPRRPHHRSSSCNWPPAECGWHVHSHDTADPNPHELTGALVGGPDEHDNFYDDRTAYEYSEVATDYNAGFQSAIARMVQQFQ